VTRSRAIAEYLAKNDPIDLELFNRIATLKSINCAKLLAKARFYSGNFILGQLFKLCTLSRLNCSVFTCLYPKRENDNLLTGKYVGWMDVFAVAAFTCVLVREIGTWLRIAKVPTAMRPVVDRKRGNTNETSVVDGCGERAGCL
jgi:hypothetical protein